MSFTNFSFQFFVMDGFRYLKNFRQHRSLPVGTYDLDCLSHLQVEQTEVDLILTEWCSRLLRGVVSSPIVLSRENLFPSGFLASGQVADNDTWPSFFRKCAEISEATRHGRIFASLRCVGHRKLRVVVIRGWHDKNELTLSIVSPLRWRVLQVIETVGLLS